MLLRNVLVIVGLLLIWAAIDPNLYQQMAPLQGGILCVAIFCSFYSFKIVSPGLLALFLIMSVLYGQDWQSQTWQVISGVSAAILLLAGTWFKQISEQQVALAKPVWSSEQTWATVGYLAVIGLWFCPRTLWGVETSAGANLYTQGKTNESFAAFQQVGNKSGGWFGFVFDTKELLDKLESTASEALQNKDYKTAQRLFQLAINFREEKNSKPSLTDYVELGIAQAGLGNYDKSEELLQWSLKSVNENSEELALSYYPFETRANDASVDCDWTEVVLRSSQELHNPKIIILNILAFVYAADNKYDESFASIQAGLNEATTDVQKADSDSSESTDARLALVTLLKDSSRIYQKTSRSLDAETCLKKALLLAKADENWEECISCSERLSNLYEQEGRVLEALAVQKRIRKFESKARDEEVAEAERAEAEASAPQGYE